MNLTQSRLKSLLDYNPGSGLFVWKVRKNRARAGAVAGKTTHYGYRAISIDRELHLAHRLAWLYMTGDWPACQIDHINRDRSDNRFSNLRAVSIGENRQNMKIRKDNSTGFTGVYRKRGRFEAKICKDRETHRLGVFATQEEAAAAYAAAKARLHTYASG